MKDRIFIIFLLWGASPFSFASSYQNFGVLADGGVWNANANAVQKSMLESDIHNLILPGDNLYGVSEGYDSVWKNWRDQKFRFDVVALGNHHGGYAQEIDYFKMPAEYYSKIIGPSQFLVLNSDREDNAREQARWLEKKIQSSRSQFLFLVYHHPPITISDRHRWEEKKKFHNAVFPVVMRYRDQITALMVGHDHLASIIDVAGLSVIVSGANWQTLPGKMVNQPVGRGWAKTLWLYNQDPHWARLDIHGKSDTVWVNFVNARLEKVSCSIRIHPTYLMRPNCNE